MNFNYRWVLLLLAGLAFSGSSIACGFVACSFERLGGAIGGTVGGAISHASKEGDKLVDKGKKTIVKPVTQAVKKGVEASVRIAVSPLKVASEAGQAALGKKSWGEANREVSSGWTTIFQDEGQAISAAGRAAHAAADGEVQIQVNTTRAVAGKGAAEVVDNVMVPRRWMNALGLSASQYASMVVKGQDPKMLLAVPLATAIRAARDQHYPTAKPLPQYIKNRFKGFYPKKVLDTARYTVGQIELTLANALNEGTKLRTGRANANVMGDVIIFGKQPATNNDDDLFWWAHELHHVQQYSEWGIDKFAYIYLNYPGENGWLERQANQKAVYVLTQLGVSLPPDVSRAAYASKGSSFLTADQLGSRPNSATCTYGNLARQITVDSPSNAAGFACRVIYQTEKGITIPWSAKHNGAYCGPKAAELVEKEKGWGWHCQQS